MSDILRLLEDAKHKVDAMTPEQREAMMNEQRKSWVRAFTTPCEHGWLDFEDCPDCREIAAIRYRTPEGQ